MIYLNSNGFTVRVEQDEIFLETIPVSRLVSSIMNEGNQVMIKNGTALVATATVDNISVNGIQLNKENAPKLLSELSRNLMHNRREGSYCLREYKIGTGRRKYYFYLPMR